MEKILKLFTYVDGINDTPFPSKEEQIEIYSFEYHANRMGGAPSITAKAMFKRCLDDIWTDNVYTSFNGERYFIMNTPSSSKSNTDARYEHELELLSEREMLNHVFFIDAVQENQGIDQKKSNSTKVQFMGDINEFAHRLQDCLEYRNLGYDVVIDEGITSEDKLVSFQDKYILEALQEAFNVFEIPYYFVGKTIHFGNTEDAIPEVIKYGSEDALLSVSKENANIKVINRITGMGSSENIPYYYPNETPKGDVGILASPTNKGLKQENLRIVDKVMFADRFNSAYKCEYLRHEGTDVAYITTIHPWGYEGTFVSGGEVKVNIEHETWGIQGKEYFNVSVEVLSDCQLYLNNIFSISSVSDLKCTYKVIKVKDNQILYIEFKNGEKLKAGSYDFLVEVSFSSIMALFKGDTAVATFSCNTNGTYLYDWKMNGKRVKPHNFGVEIINNPKLEVGDSFTQTLDKLIPFSPNLMPPIYRETMGKERFYNAINGAYPDVEGIGDFTNPFSAKNPLEGSKDFSDIKPTIKNVTNATNQNIDTFLEFAYDEDDNDDVDPTNNEYLHPYFFAKMKKTDGDYGFNLFDQASEKQTMQVSMTSGVCGACTFEIGVGQNNNMNLVHVDENGNLERDEKGNVVRVGVPQPKQNDTRNNEVWIALKKDDNTYPTFKPMPNAERNLRPSVEDTFVILGINLPKAYVLAAEQRLKEALIKYMFDSNDDRFGFSIRFSRIYLAEHPQVLNMLNENSRILLEYDNKQYTFYIDDYSYKMNDKDSLPEIEVNLVDELKTGSNSLQNALNGVKQDILSMIGGVDFLKIGLKYFIRKDVSDYTKFLLRMYGGAEFGRYKEGYTGAKIDEKGHINSDRMTSHNYNEGTLGTGFLLKNDPTTGKSSLEIDEISVRVKAMFAMAEINKMSYSGGNWIFSPAGAMCTKVEEFDGFYRCYFVADDKEKTIINEFHVNDQVRSQEYNIKTNKSSAISNRYYWRLCTNVGDDYIDLSKTDCDLNSNAPKEGDSMVVLGNRTDKQRQNAIVISAYGEGSPSITQHSGIDSYTLVGTEKTRISPTKNRFTGEFVFESGSKTYNVDDKIGYLQKQIDKSIDIWFLTGKPTLENPPANEWKDDVEKERHLGDLYYDENGKAYRFQKQDGLYLWVEVNDTGLTAALEAAKKAQQTADGKMTVYSDPRNENYKVDDIWVNATYSDNTVKYSNDILKCVKGKEGEFKISDWKLASKYTDDEAAKAYTDDKDKTLRSEINVKFEANDKAISGVVTSVGEQNKKIANAEKLAGESATNSKNAQDAADKSSQAATDSLNAANKSQEQAELAKGSADRAEQSVKNVEGKVDESALNAKNAQDAADASLSNSKLAEGHANDAKTQAGLSKDEATKAKEEAEKAKQEAIKAANSASATLQNANNAEQSAKAAQESAKASNDILTKVEDDKQVSPIEKKSLLQQKAQIEAEYDGILAQAGLYNINTEAYRRAYISAHTALDKYTASIDKYIPIGDDYGNISAYYPIRQDLLDLIEIASKDYTKTQFDIADGKIEGNIKATQVIEDRVSVNESNIKQTQDEIKTKVGKTEYDELTGRVVVAESKIEQNANSITLKVSKDEAEGIANDAVNKLQIGGRNLINESQVVNKKADNSTTPDLACFSGGTWVMGRTWMMSKKWKNEVSGMPGNGSYNNISIVPSIKFKPNTTYVFSLDKVEINSGTPTDVFNVAIYDFTSNKQIWIGSLKVSDERQYILAYTPADLIQSNDNKIVLYTGAAGSAEKREMTWYNIKLEEGNKPTEWSHAPEDTPTEEGIRSSITIKPNEISILSKTINLSKMITINSLDETVVVKGKLKTDLIDTDTLIAKNIEAEKGTIAGFNIYKGELKYTDQAGWESIVDIDGFHLGAKRGEFNIDINRTKGIKLLEAPLDLSQGSSSRENSYIKNFRLGKSYNRQDVGTLPIGTKSIMTIGTNLGNYSSTITLPSPSEGAGSIIYFMLINPCDPITLKTRGDGFIDWDGSLVSTKVIDYYRPIIFVADSNTNRWVLFHCAPK